LSPLGLLAFDIADIQSAVIWSNSFRELHFQAKHFQEALMFEAQRELDINLISGNLD
jgi:hypothetical protein